jgi:hypothetical protein
MIPSNNQPAILFLFSQPLDERNIERFGLRILKQEGFFVEIWDLTPMFYTKVWHKHTNSEKTQVNIDNYIKVTNRYEIKLLLKMKTRFNYVFDLVNTHHFYYQLLKIKLLKSGAFFIYLALGSLPLPTAGFIDVFLLRLRKYLLSPIKAIRVSSNFFQYQFFRLLTKKYSDYTLTIVSGEVSFNAALNLGYAENQIIKAHNLDYDLYLNLRKANFETDQPPYGVFLDEDYPFHNDYMYMGIPAPVTPERYFSTLFSGLTFMNKFFETEIKIAAHPRSNYDSLESIYFGKMPVYKGRTSQLVSNCAFVVCHSSTSIQLAILFNKPLIFITTDEIESTHFAKAIEYFAAVLSKPVINLDQELDTINFVELLKIDEAAYSNYKRQYIKMLNTPDVPCWQIISSELKHRFN